MRYAAIIILAIAVIWLGVDSRKARQDIADIRWELLVYKMSVSTRENQVAAYKQRVSELEAEFKGLVEEVHSLKGFKPYRPKKVGK